MAEALHWNALFVALVPFGLAGAVASYARAMRQGEFRWPQVPVAALYAVLALAGAFAVVRNLAA
jgi:hypothetical protein